jgi:toxin-antitoxin system PIN domain toxin
MKYLLDVNVLLAAIWANHSRHAEIFVWLDGKTIVLCPLGELGFLRISTHKKAINAPLDKARELLQRFATERQAERIADDLPALDSRPATSEQVTDHYLADLAANHGLKLATLDENVEHAAVVRVTKPDSAHAPDGTSDV